MVRIVRMVRMVRIVRMVGWGRIRLPKLVIIDLKFISNKVVVNTNNGLP